MEANAIESSNRQCRRILVAEDHEVNQQVAQLILEKADFQVDIVADGRQAVSAHKKNQYDLILMDIQMPVMDGHAATREIRAWELNAQSAKLKAEDGGQKTENSFQDPAQKDRMIAAESAQRIQNRQGEMRNNVEENSASTSNFQFPTSEFRKVPIIAMTGEASGSGFDPQRYPGMDDWVCKPLQRDQLLRTIDKCLGRHAGEEQDQNPLKAVDDPLDKADRKKPPIDLDRALKEFMGKKDILFAVLDQFMNRSGDQITDLRSACGRADYRAVASDAHRLKGAAANLRAGGLARAASDLETAVATEKNAAVCSLIEKLAEEFHHLERFLRQEGVCSVTSN